MAYGQQKLISHGSGGWEIQGQDARNLESGASLLPGSQRPPLHRVLT